LSKSATDAELNINDSTTLNTISSGGYFQGSMLDLKFGSVHSQIFYSTKDLFELENSNNNEILKDEVVGTIVEMGNPNITIGVSGLHSLITGINSTELLVYGTHFNTSFDKVKMYGEAALIKNSGRGIYIGGQWKEKSIKSKLSFRYYSKNFINYYSRAQAASDGNDKDADEQGLLFSTTFKLHKNIRLWAAYDMWQTLSTTIYNNEQEIGIYIKPGKKSRLYTTYGIEYSDLINVNKTNSFFKNQIYAYINDNIGINYTGKLRFQDEYKDLNGYIWIQPIIKLGAIFKIKTKLRYSSSDFSNKNKDIWKTYMEESFRIKDAYYISTQYIHTYYRDKKKDSVNYFLLKASLNP